MGGLHQPKQPRSLHQVMKRLTTLDPAPGFGVVRRKTIFYNVWMALLVLLTILTTKIVVVTKVDERYAPKTIRTCARVRLVVMEVLIVVRTWRRLVRNLEEIVDVMPICMEMMMKMIWPDLVVGCLMMNPKMVLLIQWVVWPDLVVGCLLMHPKMMLSMQLMMRPNLVFGMELMGHPKLMISMELIMQPTLMILMEFQILMGSKSNRSYSDDINVSVE